MLPNSASGTRALRVSRVALRSYRILVTWRPGSYLCLSFLVQTHPNASVEEGTFSSRGSRRSASVLLDGCLCHSCSVVFMGTLVSSIQVDQASGGRMAPTWRQRQPTCPLLSPALLVPRRKMPAMGILAIWPVGCLFGSSQPGPFEEILRPIW